MPTRKPFVCKRCKRSFSMAAHLARHSRVHAPNRPSSARKRAATPRWDISAPPNQFAGVITDLRAGHQALTAERDVLDGRLAALESALTAIDGGVPRRNFRVPAARAKRRRTASADGAAFRPGSLKDHIQRVFAKSAGPMPVANITAAVVRSGFKSKNKTLATTVGITLAEMAGVRRVGRGVYGR